MGVIEDNKGRIIYDPGNFTSNDIFSYRSMICPFSGRQSADANVRIEINPVNDPPVTDNLRLKIFENQTNLIYLEADDPDDDILNFFIETLPENGTLFQYSNEERGSEM